jgi:hypothetical protein
MKNTRLYGSIEWSGSKSAPMVNKSIARCSSNSRLNDLQQKIDGKCQKSSGDEIFSESGADSQNKLQNKEEDESMISQDYAFNNSFPNSFSTHSKLKNYIRFRSKFHIRFKFKRSFDILCLGLLFKLFFFLIKVLT